MELQQLQKYLKKQKIPMAYLVHPDPNLSYLTQNEHTNAYLFIAQNIADLYLSPLDNPPKLENISVNILSKGWEKKLVNKKITKVGINKKSLTLVEFDKVKKLFPKAKFIDISNELQRIRRQKNSLELERISKACQITSKSFDSVVNELSKGSLKTEQDVALFIEKTIRQQGATLAFSTISASHKNAAIPHHKTTTQKLRKGFLLMDFGAKHNNYCADMTRMVYLGTPSEKEKKIYNLLLKAQTNAIKSVAEGISFKDLDKGVRDHLGKYSSNFIHSLGHGIGVEVHEDPVFSEGANVELNVPFTIEPGIYLNGKFGLRIEDTVVLDNQKIRVLTKASKELVIIPWQ